MPCTEHRRPAPAPGLLSPWAALLLLALGGCAQAPAPKPAPSPAPTPAPARAQLPAPPAAPVAPTRAPAAAPTSPTEPARAGPVPRQPRYVTLPAPPAPRNAQALRLQLAQRLVAAHPDTSYTGKPPERLLAIPVLEIELNGDGSVRSIQVLRKPTTGNEATVLAMAAVRRAAPYGDVSKLPRPWKVVETFLFDDELRFKPRTLDGD